MKFEIIDDYGDNFAIEYNTFSKQASVSRNGEQLARNNPREYIYDVHGKQKKVILTGSTFSLKAKIDQKEHELFRMGLIDFLICLLPLILGLLIGSVAAIILGVTAFYLTSCTLPLTAAAWKRLLIGIGYTLATLVIFVIFFTIAPKIAIYPQTVAAAISYLEILL